MLNDKQLEKRLLRALKSLELMNDAVGPTPLRHKLSEYIVKMRIEIRNFDQYKYEHSEEEPW